MRPGNSQMVFPGSSKTDLEEWLPFFHSYPCPHILPALLLKASAYVILGAHRLSCCQMSFLLWSLP